MKYIYIYIYNGPVCVYICDSFFTGGVAEEEAEDDDGVAG